MRKCIRFGIFVVSMLVILFISLVNKNRMLKQYVDALEQFDEQQFLSVWVNDNNNHSSSQDEGGSAPLANETFKIEDDDNGTTIWDNLPKSELLVNENFLKRRQEMDKPQCGIFYFYHIGKTGGRSVSEWLREVSKKSMYHRKSRIEFFDFWDGMGKQHNPPKWKKSLPKIFQIIKFGRLNPDDSRARALGSSTTWLAIHHHHRSPGLRYMIPKLRRWRHTLRRKGCELIVATVVREPASRLTSKLFYNKTPLDKFQQFIQKKPDGQAMYLLYNTCERRTDPNTEPNCYLPYNETKSGHVATQEEITEVIQYLKDDFDIVGRTEYLDQFYDQVAYFTGWNKLLTGKGSRVAHKNKSQKAYEITSEMQHQIKRAVHDDVLFWNQLFATTNITNPHPNPSITNTSGSQS